MSRRAEQPEDHRVLLTPVTRGVLAVAWHSIEHSRTVLKVAYSSIMPLPDVLVRPQAISGPLNDHFPPDGE